MPVVWEDLYLLVFSFAGVVGALCAAAVAYLIRARAGFLRCRDGVGERRSIPLGPYEVPASWIVSGTPVFRSNYFGSSYDKSTSSGIWECTGPARFVWHYGVDETIYILEGSAEIEYLGRRFTLGAGDCTHFIAGTAANWSVAERIKKSYTLYEPGSLVRKVRRLLRMVGLDGTGTR